MTMTHATPATGIESTAPAMGALRKAVWAVLVSVTKVRQFGRMQRVLFELSDHQLEDIGLQRADIRDFSQWLVRGKGVNRWEGSAGSAAQRFERF